MRLTARAKGTLLLALGLALGAYAFQRLAPALLAAGLMGHLVYARFRFQELTVNARFAADVEGPARTVFQDRRVRVGYRLHVHPPGVHTTVTVPESEDLLVEQVTTELRGAYPTGMRLDVTAQVVPRRRGRFRLETLHLDLTGPDGLFEQDYAVRVPVEFTAQAPRSALEEGAEMRELQEIAASSKAAPGAVSLELLTHRSYRPSDRDHDIDWKVSARHQELLTRIHRQEVDRQLVILVDATRPMRYQRGGRSMLDHVSRLAVAMARSAHSQGTEVGFAAFDETSVLAHRQPAADRSVPREVARAVAELPDPIPVTSEDLVVARARERPDDEAPSRFEQTVGSFLGSGNRLPHGLAEAINAFHGQAQARTYVVFTPHTYRPDEADTILTTLARGPNRVLVAAPFAPYYLGVDRELRVQDVERASEAWAEHQARLARLEAAGLDTVNLSPNLRARDLARAREGGPR